MPRVSHDHPDRVLACPECDTAGKLFKRTGRGNAYVGDPEAEYVCRSCRATFDEPHEREARQWRPGRGATAGERGVGRIMAELSVEEFDNIVHGDGTA